MSKISRLLLGAVIGHAAMVSAAGASPFSGTLNIGIHNADIGFVGVFQGAGAGTSTASAVALPSGVFAGTASSPVTDVAPLSAALVKLAGNLAGAFSGNPLTGAMPVQGVVALKGNIGFGPQTILGVPLFTNHTAQSGVGAVGLGVGGSVVQALTNGAYATAFHTIWSEGARTLTGLSYVYSYHFATGKVASNTVTSRFLNATAMYTGTDSRTPGGVGTVTLVSPTKVVTDREGLGPTWVILGTLTLNFVPEPGTLTLLGFGVAGLAVLGQRRRFRPQRVERGARWSRPPFGRL